MIIYEDTNILVSGAFLKCFRIFLRYNQLSFSVSIIIFLIRHSLVVLTLSDYSGTLCTTQGQPFSCGVDRGVLDPRSPPPLTAFPATSYPAPCPLLPAPAPSTLASRPLLQGRRRFLKSGTAIERRRRNFREGQRPEQGERTREWVLLSRKGGGGGVRGISAEIFLRGGGGFGGSPPRFLFNLKMSVEAILMHFETMFVCEIRLIVQAFHVAVFKRVLNATTKE